MVGAAGGLYAGAVTELLSRATRILIVKPSSLGDIVHALPVLAAVRRARPDAHIAWLVNTTFAPLLEGHPLLNEVIGFDRRRFGRMLRSPRAALEFVRFCGSLRARRFDLVLELQGLFRSGFLAWISGARVRVGFAGARELGAFFVTHRVAAPAGGRSASSSDRHAVAWNRLLLERLGVDAAAPEFPLAVRAEETAAARRLLADAGVAADSFTALLPGARWESKRWPATRWARLIDALDAAGGGPCVLLGAPDERGIAQAIRATARATAADLVGRTSLRELAAILSLATRVVCCDSGPMHMAAALNRPLVALFGPTNPARTGPYTDAGQVVRLPLACSPCYERVCPLGHHDCLATLDVDRVMDAIGRCGSGS